VHHRSVCRLLMSQLRLAALIASETEVRRKFETHSGACPARWIFWGDGGQNKLILGASWVLRLGLEAFNCKMPMA
jgi:hypothetical protein